MKEGSHRQLPGPAPGAAGLGNHGPAARGVLNVRGGITGPRLLLLCWALANGRPRGRRAGLGAAFAWRYGSCVLLNICHLFSAGWLENRSQRAG